MPRAPLTPPTPPLPLSPAPVSQPAQTPDPEQTAKIAGLVYSSDEEPGITRRRSGRGFSYFTPDGKRITDRRTIARLKALVIPPAWTDVWIAPSPRGHLQATGRDARGRKQYRYHDDWHAARDEVKFDRVLAFGRALPRIRRRAKRHMGGPPLARRTVLGTVVRLLETTLIRVGNEAYARENHSYGLTTLRGRHVEANGRELCFDFKGKSGKRQQIRVTDRRAAKVIHALQDLPGQEIFQYIDEDGARQHIDSADVNAYLKEIAEDDFTAKDFRTWAGTVLAAWALSEVETGKVGASDGDAARRRAIAQAVKRVARQLGNTPAVCRRSYIHPEIVNAYLDGSLIRSLTARIEARLKRDLDGLSEQEVAVLVVLQRRLRREQRARGGET